MSSFWSERQWQMSLPLSSIQRSCQPEGFCFLPLNKDMKVRFFSKALCKGYIGLIPQMNASPTLPLAERLVIPTQHPGVR